MKQTGPSTQPSMDSFDIEMVIPHWEKMIKQSRSSSELKLHYDRLQFLARELDPFHQEFTPEIEQVLDFYGLKEALKNPFVFTNMLLQLLDLLENKLKDTSLLS